MTSTIKVDTIQDSGGNTIISSDGSGTITQTASIGSFRSTGIDDNASSTAITINSSDWLEIKSNSYLLWGIGSTARPGIIGDNVNKVLAFHNNNSERMRIGSAGTVLIDKTSTNYQTVGHELRDGGRAFHTAAGGKSLSLVRLTDDGPIMDLYNSAGNEIGQIGVDFTDNLFISGNSNHAGLNFGTASVVPYKNGANLDATIDWGSSATRFKDLYLSGSAYLGGTTSANALDDYEEGTFTLSGIRVSWSEEGSTTGKYVKVGRYVHCSVSATVTNMVYDGSGSGWAFGGFPFVIADAAIANFSECTCFTSAVDSLCNIGSELFARNNRYSITGIASSSFNSGAKKLKFTVTYYTNS